MQTRTIQVGSGYGAEYTGIYLFAEITWAKRSRIIQKYTKYHPVTGQVLSSDFIAIQAETIWAALKQQPPSQPITLEKLLSEENGVPIGLGELFSDTANRLCAVSQEEAAFLSEPSDAINQTRQSPNSASAKSSDGHQNNLPTSRLEQSSNSSSSLTR